MAAIYTAKKYLLLQNPTQQDLGSFFLSDLGVAYSIEQVKSCAKCFNQLANLIQRSKLQNLVKKFKGSKYFEVARIVTASFQKKKSSGALVNQVSASTADHSSS